MGFPSFHQKVISLSNICSIHFFNLIFIQLFYDFIQRFENLSYLKIISYSEKNTNLVDFLTGPIPYPLLLDAIFSHKNNKDSKPISA